MCVSVVQASVFAHFVAPALDEMWSGPDVALPELDGTLPDCTEMSSLAEISSHICESFFMSPERTLECEEPVRNIYRSLGLAVDGLLAMVLDSSRQVSHGLVGIDLVTHSLLCGPILALVLMLCLRKGQWVNE